MASTSTAMQGAAPEMTLNLSRRRPVGATSLRLPPFGFGGAPIGGLFSVVEDGTARATLEAAWHEGIRYFDTAPLYGRGLSELRTGAFLRNRSRNDFWITTKVGRYLSRPENPDCFDRGSWTGGLNFQGTFDYTYDGLLRSYEQSLQRLGLTTVDALIIHDLDHGYHDDAALARHTRDLQEGGIRALEELKSHGEIKAYGMGINTDRALNNIAPLVPLDFIMLAMPYTLLDQRCLGKGLARCLAQNISIIIGSPFASGLLAKGSQGGGNYGYNRAPKAVVEKVRAMEVVCAAYGVSLPAAALQFPLAHPAVVSVVSGAERPDQVEMNIMALDEEIPSAFWADLKSRALLDPTAPTPQQAGRS